MVSWTSNIHNNYTSIPNLMYSSSLSSQCNMHTHHPRVWSGSYLLATTCVAMRCLCRCWPTPWSSGHRGLFVPSSWSTRATLVHWVACSSDWTLTFSSNYSVCTRLYFYPGTMIPFHSWLLCYQNWRKFNCSSELPVLLLNASCSVTISIFAYYFLLFLYLCLFVVLCSWKLQCHVPKNHVICQDCSRQVLGVVYQARSALTSWKNRETG